MQTVSDNITYIKEKNQKIATFLAFALIPLSGFATDIYIPSLPTMAGEMQVSSIQVQLTLSIFLISYGVSQLFIGSVLDSFGRYKICLYALLIFAAASIVIAITHNIYLIYFMRVIHGLTVGCIVVAKRAYFVDLFEGDQLKHYLSLFSIIWSTGPIIAPFVGGYLQLAFGWESNFYFLAGFALVFALLEFLFSGETLKHFTDFQLKKIVGIYVSMIKTTCFTLGIVMLGLAYCMVMVYNMTGPFIIEHELKFSPVIAGYSSLVLGFAWMVGGFIGKATINRPFFRRLAINSALQLLFVTLMILSLSLISNLYSLIFFAFIIHIGAGYTFNNYFTFCLSKFPKNAGIAGGLTGGITYVIVSFLSYGVVNLFPAKDERNLSYSYLVMILISVLVMFVIMKTRKKGELTI
ncbi:putative MFS family arabinose efflux permease [Pedobacter psychrotolerans]|uniref:Bcr/CflA family drug resistance efflux transporter n=1 Tax=Pedobacter psychrotolerans TaxID=1843235 RepID=A0A4R2HLN0_9SPHI|nr:MFS transporter [Pedobacter psychrotolerans]TCO28655.1 putative MFS family arabinose efflux permease [Pedobacter psychrotolerans]GGE50711.1 Bcr/CflA family drug resistance efflux transporter [Pedobacter psychrotolerans]